MEIHWFAKNKSAAPERLAVQKQANSRSNMMKAS